MSLISVIMPVYNTEEYLNDAISAVLNQTYSDVELILINDGSDESCTNTLNQIAMADSRISIYHSTTRQGVAAARNLGIDKASGDYVYFMDSDDYIPENALQLLADNIDDYPMISGRQKKKNNINREAISEKVANMTEDETDVYIYTDKKFNLIKNKSALNRLLRKDFMTQFNLRFVEDTERYSDLTFMVPALLNVSDVPYVKQCIYYKRRRNDPVNSPSLMQMGAEGRIHDFLHIYNTLKTQYTDTTFNTFLDKQLIDFYKKPVIRFFKKNENVDKVFDELATAFAKVDKSELHKRSSRLRKETSHIKTGDIQSFKKVNLKHQRLRKLKRSVKSRRNLYIQLYRSLFMKMPMKQNLVVFESFLGKSYSDNPKYIYEYMLANNMNYQFVWITRERQSIPGNPKQVRRFSLRYYYYLARAKYWVNNSRMPKTLNKREGNIYLQTWHGTPLKTLVFDQKNIYSADPKYKHNFYKQSRRWDYLISPNQYSSDIFRRAFKYDKTMLEYGYPRNDILYQKNNNDDIQALKQQMGIPQDKQVILYAPTWRDNEFFARGQYKFTLHLDLAMLQRELGDDYIVLLRTHYHIANSIDVSEFAGFVYDFSNYNDIAEMYLVTDILITDYSSVFFDFANLKRPILFYTYDLANYRDNMRGLYFDIESEVPGPLLETSEEVVDAVKNIDQIQVDYQELYDAFYDRFCHWDDGHASENTVKAVFGET